ncbi:MAG: carbohydrate ABC transporter permease [Acidothermales bacterium]|nr:carbohydrate ABC transporter permease [Acidothermales bacterium]
MTTTRRPDAPSRVGSFSLWLGIALLSLLTVAPLVWMFSGAFKTQDDIYGISPIPPHPTLGNFVDVFTKIPFARYIFNSAFVAIIVTLVALLFHSMAGYALARLRFPGREIIFTSIFATLLVSVPVILVPLFIVVKTLGLVNSYWGLIVPAIFNAFGIFFLRQFYLSLPRELEEAAAVDGFGYWRIYWHIVLPLSRPLLAALAVFFFLANWNSFLWPLTITENPNLWMIQVGIASFQQQYAAAWNYIMAAATVAALPTLALFFVFQRRLAETIKFSGVGG